MTTPSASNHRHYLTITCFAMEESTERDGKVGEWIKKHDSEDQVEPNEEDSDGEMEEAADAPEEDGPAPKQSYKSWKKKYRKMRDAFERKMREGEEIYRREMRAIETNKRIAIEIDRLLDLLLEVNNTPQIPPEKRFDLSIPFSSAGTSDILPGEMYLPIDMPGNDRARGAEKPSQALRDMLVEIPHHRYAAAAELFPNVVSDLEAGVGGEGPGADMLASASHQHPASFLTADDIDNYLWELDQRIAEDRRDRGLSPLPVVPTLAPKARDPTGSAGATAAATSATADPNAAARDFALRNPTSVYNWLRKHAPKTFLQDAEATSVVDVDAAETPHPERPSGSRSRAKFEPAKRGGKVATPASTPTTATKRASGVARGAAKRSRQSAVTTADVADEAKDEEGDEMALDETAAATPTAAKGKRKRAADDDAGYRPKGGSARPSKKKRKSEAGDATPTSARSGKTAKTKAAAVADADADEDAAIEDAE
ncbi:hypothetical protein PoMZ_02318 [Pyricularia oryzae]|uniref:IEC3 subunit of the Ino80 complex, chromatin re-modelling-domain-containing protein n=1 Tax=Pyricularia oryzae TaxID=318829 RepID=A0A4P7NB21_PYROR|nr:hypothetical protein PoMZ_02318 [Pyricularia oryzae]